MAANSSLSSSAPRSGALYTRNSARLRRRRWEERTMVLLMRVSIAGAALILLAILGVIVYRGIGALSWEMVTQPPKGGFYLGGKGGILNAILGSVYLAFGATIFAAFLAVPLVFFLHVYADKSRFAEVVRLIMDVLWGIPSIVYGAFGFALMIAMGMRASLLAGIITVGLVIVPILARTLDEVVRLAPGELGETTLSLGATKAEWLAVLVRQSLPGLGTALLLAFARGIGDAAAALFTAGFTDRVPDGLMRPVATLPLTVYFLLSTPTAAVRARAYAAGLILTVIILGLSLIGHLTMRRLGRHVIR